MNMTDKHPRTPEEIKKGLERCCRDVCFGDDEICPYRCEGSSLCVGAMTEDALAYIQQLEEQIRNLTKMAPKWISVEERLPESNEDVLITYGDGRVAIAYYDEDDELFWRKGDDAYRGVSATHWMPLPKLPEPPKEG